LNDRPPDRDPDRSAHGCRPARPVAGAAERLSRLFADGEWATRREWLRTRSDRNAFVSANILLILERCGTLPDALAHQAVEARRRLATYRVGHRAYFWPLAGTRSTMADAPPLWRHRLLVLSPDADDSALVQLVLKDAGFDDPLISDLATYRASPPRFALPAFQRHLGAEHTWLTWFPGPERWHDHKLETVDLGVDANVLLYLGTIGRLDAPGTAETIAFVAESVTSGRVAREPFRVSLSYPRPVLLLYLVARAAAWGDVAALRALDGAIVDQLRTSRIDSTVELLCRETALRILGAPPMARSLPTPDGRGAFYVWPLLGLPLQRAPMLLPLAAAPVTHVRFTSEALEWALRLWLETP